MPRKRSNKRNKPLSDQKQHANILQNHKLATYGLANEENHDNEPKIIESISNIKSILDDNNENSKPTHSSANQGAESNTTALYNELDTFRQKWKRELGDSGEQSKDAAEKREFGTTTSSNQENVIKQPEASKSTTTTNDDVRDAFRVTELDTPETIYAKAKKLFLIAADLVHDEMHFESIRYYKQAMRLCPDIEKLIFLEQCDASKKENGSSEAHTGQSDGKPTASDTKEEDDADKTPIYDRIQESYYESIKDGAYTFSKPNHKYKFNCVHISHLPRELLVQIFHYVVGEELDLASLESLGLVCRGFYLLSRDSLLWRSICYNTWKDLTPLKQSIYTDWRLMYMNRPRVNFDGVYISRTRYVRQGDVGFQDLTYRPFHTVRYYRYLRFFPNRRVLILTTNEEPEKIVPIFRHALHSKQFSSELSILDGTFEFIDENHIDIKAEKDCSVPISQRRQPQYWSRQTPLWQKLNLKFKVKTYDTKPYKNNVLKWVEYTLTTRLETGQEVETFDLSADLFPNLIFSRVKKFNLRSSRPLASH